MNKLPIWRKGLSWGLALTVLMAVFALYAQPDFLRMLADQLWACF